MILQYWKHVEKSYVKMAGVIQDNGKAQRGMAKVTWLGLMVPNTRENGLMISVMDQAL